jgi:hypothetical protein
MRVIFLFIFLPVICSTLTLNCNNSSPTNPQTTPPAETVEEDDRIFIVDRTGKKWDVTFAKEKYGMEPSNFQYGLGPNAIKPVLNPVMLSPGDEGYPDPSETFLVVGVQFNGHTRAYPLKYIISHEIVDERFDQDFVAVGY